MPTSKKDAQVIAQDHLDIEERIRRRAHEIFLARGGQPGSELDDWLQAERELLGSRGQPAQDRATTVGSAKTPVS